MITQYVRYALAAVLLAVLGLGTFWGGLELWGRWNDEWSGYNASTKIGDGYCNIAVVPVQGTIEGYDDGNTGRFTTPADVRAILNKAVAEPGIVGAMIDIDSRGGAPAASEAIMQAVREADEYLYTLALIGDYGTSGGYLAALGAEHIMASPFSDVGSIGITMSYLSYVEQNEAQGIAYESLSTAPLKDYGDPDKPLTTEERERILRDLGIMHEHFIEVIAERRAMPREEVVALADGASFPGKLALEKKLVDGLGSRLEARQWFADKLQVSVDDVVLCE